MLTTHNSHTLFMPTVVVVLFLGSALHYQLEVTLKAYCSELATYTGHAPAVSLFFSSSHEMQCSWWL